MRIIIPIVIEIQRTLTVHTIIQNLLPITILIPILKLIPIIKLIKWMLIILIIIKKLTSNNNTNFKSNNTKNKW